MTDKSIANWNTFANNFDNSSQEPTMSQAFQEVLKAKADHIIRYQNPFSKDSHTRYIFSKLYDRQLDAQAQMSLLDSLVSILSNPRYGFSLHYPDRYTLADQEFSSSSQLYDYLKDSLGLPNSFQVPEEKFRYFLDQLNMGKLPEKRPSAEWRLFTEKLLTPDQVNTDLEGLTVDEQTWLAFQEW